MPDHAGLPFGAGQHPYFTVGTPLVDSAELQLPGQRDSSSTRRADCRRAICCRVAGIRVSTFASRGGIGALVLDDCFTDLDRDADGHARVSPADPGSGRSVVVWMDERYRYVQVFSGDTLAPDRRRQRAGDRADDLSARCLSHGHRSDRAAARRNVLARMGHRPVFDKLRLRLSKQDPKLRALRSRKSMATQRMHRGLVALSASAVAAIYLAGYLRTQSADASIGAAAVPTGQTVAVAATPRTDPFVQRQVPVAPRTVPPRARAGTGSDRPAAVASLGWLAQGRHLYRARARVGAATSGSASRSRAAGLPTSTITRSTLQYPLRDIAGLPSQVVQRQSAQVDIVSRATYSSQAFKGAVSQALSKAA